MAAKVSYCLFFDKFTFFAHLIITKQIDHVRNRFKSKSNHCR